MREEKRKGKKGRTNRQRTEPRTKSIKREHVAKMADLCGKRELGEESKAQELERFKVGPGREVLRGARTL